MSRAERLEEARVWQAKADDAARQLTTETDPYRARLLRRGVEVWGGQARELRRMPRPQRRRWVATSVACPTASALFLGPAMYAGGLPAGYVLVGAVGPAVIVAAFWAAVLVQRMPRDVDTRTRLRGPDLLETEQGVEEVAFR